MSTDSVVDMRNQYAVYWEWYQSYDDGSPMVKDGVEILVQVQKQTKSSTDGNSSVVAWDYELNVPYALVEGSLIWLGRLHNLTPITFIAAVWDIPTPGLLQVIDTEEYPDDTGLMFDRWAMCKKFGNVIRGQWMQSLQP